MIKVHVVSERYVCPNCLNGLHGDCIVPPTPRTYSNCMCKRFKHIIQIRENLPSKKPRRRPGSSGTSGEIAAAQALTNAGLLFKMQVSIKTRFREWPFIVDFLVEDKVVYEVQGGLHYRTWGGRIANNRMKKDRAKRNCIIAEGYPFVETTDKMVKSCPAQVVYYIKEALANPKKYMQLDPTDRAELEENKP